MKTLLKPTIKYFLYFNLFIVLVILLCFSKVQFQDLVDIFGIKTIVLTAVITEFAMLAAAYGTAKDGGLRPSTDERDDLCHLKSYKVTFAIMESLALGYFAYCLITEPKSVPYYLIYILFLSNLIQSALYTYYQRKI